MQLLFFSFSLVLNGCNSGASSNLQAHLDATHAWWCRARCWRSVDGRAAPRSCAERTVCTPHSLFETPLLPPGVPRKDEAACCCWRWRPHAVAASKYEAPLKSSGFECRHPAPASRVDFVSADSDSRYVDGALAPPGAVGHAPFRFGRDWIVPFLIATDPWPAATPPSPTPPPPALRRSGPYTSTARAS